MKQKVLIAEDENEIRSLVRRCLENAGYDVVEAANGAAAIVALHSDAFDLLITDILMPDTDGLEAIIYARKMHPQMKVIAVSALANALHLSNARGLGATRVLPKPFMPSDLLALVREVIGEPASV